MSAGEGAATGIKVRGFLRGLSGAQHHRHGDEKEDAENGDIQDGIASGRFGGEGGGNHYMPSSSSRMAADLGSMFLLAYFT